MNKPTVICFEGKQIVLTVLIIYQPRRVFLFLFRSERGDIRFRTAQRIKVIEAVYGTLR